MVSKVVQKFFRPDGQLSVAGFVFAFVAAETNLFIQIRLAQIIWHWLAQ